MAASTSALTSIRIERRGGLAGLRASAEVMAAELSASQRAAVVQLLAAPAARGAPSPAPGADRYRFRVSVRTADGGEQVLDLAESEMPDALAGLARPRVP